MIRRRRCTGLVLLVLWSLACAGPARRPLVDPFPLRFPLTEAGNLEIDGLVTGQPWAKNGIVYVSTDDRYLTAVVVSSRGVLWRRTGSGCPGELEGTAGPEDLAEPVLRIEGKRLRAFNKGGGKIWAFEAGEADPAAPALAGGRVFLGDSERRFYCLDAATGKTVWSRRLQGAPLQPAVVSGGTVAVAAANSVVYLLSRKGGSILSWEAVPSRIVYPLALAGENLLVSSASPDLVALDMRSGKRTGQYQAPGPLVAGAVWSAPYVILFVEDEESGRQRLLFLRSR